MSTNVDIIDAIDIVDLVLSDNKVYEQERLYYCDKLQKQNKKEATKHL